MKEISQEFSELIFTELLEISVILKVLIYCRYIRNHRIWLRIVSTIYFTFNQKNRAIAGPAFINCPNFIKIPY